MKNFLLSLLSSSDLKYLEPHLKSARFEQHHVLFEADEQIRYVYFPTGAVISLVVTLSTGEMVEAAMVGVDGVVGASAALDGKVSLSRGIVQLGGEIIVCDPEALKSVRVEGRRVGPAGAAMLKAVREAALRLSRAALTDGEVLSSWDKLIDYCKANMAAYKYPRSIEFIDELPKTTTGKILRRELRDQATG